MGIIMGIMPAICCPAYCMPAGGGKAAIDVIGKYCGACHT